MENNIIKVNQITVEDTEHYTVLKLLHKLINKINELVYANGDIYDKLDYLLKDGLSEEVVKALTEWLNDGTLSDIITEEVLVEIDSRINELNAQLSSIENRKANKTITDSLQEQINSLVVNAGDPESSSAEIVQARELSPTLFNNLKRIENGKYPFDDSATLLKNGDYLNRECIKFFQLSNVDLTKDYYIQQLSNFTFDSNVRRIVIRDNFDNLVFEGVYESDDLFTGVQFGTLVNGKSKCIFVIDWSKVNIPFYNYTLDETKLSKSVMINVSYEVLPNYSPVVNFIKNIEMNGADTGKIYAFNKINKSVDGATLLAIYDVENNIEVASFNKWDTDIDKSSNVIYLEQQNSSGITAKVTVDWEGIGDGFSYTSDSQSVGMYTISPSCYDKKFKLSHFDNDVVKNVDVLNIKKVYGVKDIETNVYFKNMMKGYTDELIFNKEWGTSSQLRNNFLRNTGAASSNENESIKIYCDDNVNNEIAKIQFENVCCEKTVGLGETKRCMFIGDSITDRGVYLSELKKLFDNDVMNIEFVGTQGNEIKHEGRSSWGSYDFINSQEYAGRTNSFFNPSTNVFDYSYYANNNPSISPDWIFIMLGTNDTWRPMNNKYTADYINQMIDSIHNYDRTIKVGVCLIIPPYLGELTSTTGDKSSGLTKNLHFEINKRLLTKFENKESSNTYIVPICSYIDAENNFVMVDEKINSRNEELRKVCSDIIHPADGGYFQIADGFYSFIKNNI